MIYIATRNPGKLAEFKSMMCGYDYRIEPAPDSVRFPAEDGSTYEEIATAKARACFDQTGVPSIGDDSGLEVTSLGGAPGIHTARYAGPGASDARRNRRILWYMRQFDDRRAFDVTALVLVGLSGMVTVRGEVAGRISCSPHGSRGFGHDPIFIPQNGGGRTYAEMEWNKAAYSSRGVAVCHLLGIIGDDYCG